MIKKCLVCLKSFEARSDAKTCSAKCRKRLQRTKPKSEMLKEAYEEAISSARLLSMYLDDPTLKARAQNSLASIIKTSCEYMPDYFRLALAEELRQSVSSGTYLKYALNRSEMGHGDVTYVTEWE